MAARVANYTGVSIKVRFPGGGDATSMAQLSGGQKTMVALCLIFAIQRCDPAPFYIFDEIDAALDATHRSALANMIASQAKLGQEGDGEEAEGGEEQQQQEGGEEAEGEEGGKGKKEKEQPPQFVTTTFRPELIKCADKCYGVTHARKVSTVRAIAPQEALRIIAEDQNRQKQHIGVS